MDITSGQRGAACLSLAGRWTLLKTKRGRRFSALWSQTLNNHTSKRAPLLTVFKPLSPRIYFWLIGFRSSLYWKLLTLSRDWLASFGSGHYLVSSPRMMIVCRNLISHTSNAETRFIDLQSCVAIVWLVGEPVPKWKNGIQSWAHRCIVYLLFSLRLPFPLPLVTLYEYSIRQQGLCSPSSSSDSVCK